MKSGLEGRNNLVLEELEGTSYPVVSMKSGLEGRNNLAWWFRTSHDNHCLNEVRPRRPEQCGRDPIDAVCKIVSMKSGLEGRNNPPDARPSRAMAVVSMKSGLEGRNNLRKTCLYGT